MADATGEQQHVGVDLKSLGDDLIRLCSENPLLVATLVLVVLLGAKIVLSSSSSGAKQRQSSREAPPAKDVDVDADAASPKKGKKKKKKAKKKSAAAATGEEEATAEEETTADKSATEKLASGGGGGKKSKKKKKGPATTTTADAKTSTAPANGHKNGNKKKGEGAPSGGGGGPAPTAPDDESDSDASSKETPVVASNANAGKKKKKAKGPTTNAAGLTRQQQADVDDGWEVAVDVKKKKKGGGGAKKKPATGSAGGANKMNETSETTESVSVPSNKMGILIGPKGATLQSIQTATDCKIETPQGGNRPAGNAPVTVKVSGRAGDVKRAVGAIREICDKGYTTVTQGEGFTENSVSVHPRVLSELVGPGGSVIRSIQENCDVKITIPSTEWRPGNTSIQKVRPVRVGVAGSKEACTAAKAVIVSISRYHHHEVTHPGMVHREVEVPSHYLNFIIGVKGSEIRHMKGNYQCDVHIPNADSYSENVIVVGRPANVAKTVAHIEKLMDRAAEQGARAYDDEYF